MVIRVVFGVPPPTPPLNSVTWANTPLMDHLPFESDVMLFRVPCCVSYSLPFTRVGARNSRLWIFPFVKPVLKEVVTLKLELQ